MGGIQLARSGIGAGCAVALCHGNCNSTQRVAGKIETLQIQQAVLWMKAVVSVAKEAAQRGLLGATCMGYDLKKSMASTKPSQKTLGGVLVPAPPVGFRKVGATLTALVEGHYLIASTDACLCRSPVRWLMGLNGTVVDADAGQLARAFLGRQILPVSRAQSRS